MKYAIISPHKMYNSSNKFDFTTISNMANVPYVYSVGRSFLQCVSLTVRSEKGGGDTNHMILKNPINNPLV